VSAQATIEHVQLFAEDTVAHLRQALKNPLMESEEKAITRAEKDVWIMVLDLLKEKK